MAEEKYWLIPNMRQLICGYRIANTDQRCRMVHQFLTSGHEPAAFPDCIVGDGDEFQGVPRNMWTDATDKTWVRRIDHNANAHTGAVELHAEIAWIRPLKWQSGQPSEPGFYWIAGEGTWLGLIQLQHDLTIWLLGSPVPNTLHGIFDERAGIANRFAGPIPEPIS